MVGAFRTVAIGEAQSETDREKGRDKDGKIEKNKYRGWK
jgi:hypothetical protein